MKENFDENLAADMFNKPPTPRTMVARYKRKLETNSDYEEEKSIYRWAHDVRQSILQLIGAKEERRLWDFIKASRRCMEGNMSDYMTWGRTIMDSRSIIYSASVKQEKGPDYGIRTLSSCEAEHFDEIQKLRSCFPPPLQPQHIAEAHLEYYGRLLHIEQLWASDLFLYDLPAAYHGAGKIAVKHFIETLGRIIALFRDPKTQPDKIEAEFKSLEAAQTVISAIAKEEF